ncbi:MAG: glucose-6-phosphate isomerase [Phycisphaeraceae bacterium]|nr:glucose-6-phosphate isomerase [Phycisphaeraceae bacterium]
MDPSLLWQRYQQYLCSCPSLGLRLDISRMTFSPEFFAQMADLTALAFDGMAQLESGVIANPDEKRMVGHYWLRAPDLAPQDDIAREIEQTIQRVSAFAAKVHSGQIKPPTAKKFTDVLVVGIGGSALGPQLVADALGGLAGKKDKLTPHFLDNTDPDGFDRELSRLAGKLKSTLVLVISKSGGTKETRNGMLETQWAFARKKLAFAPQAVAITGRDSELDKLAVKEGWLDRFPMWDWVGGRTSVLSAVGLLPAALQGLDIAGLLDGAAEMDRLTRQRDAQRNPAALLALMWHFATAGKGEKQMVILPYKDRLLLLSRYLQQLVMESLGKNRDLDGHDVLQGLTVFGNKGSTDQHAFVQQLRDGLDDFFVTFIVVLQDRMGPAARLEQPVEPGTTSGDYLNGFWQGTRQALFESGRGSITLTLEKFDARALGALIALYERAVGFYAELVHINAYHQPGVEAGKKAAAAVLDLQKKVVAALQADAQPATADQIAQRLGQPDQAEAVFHILDHLAANKRHIATRRGKFVWKK